MKKIPYELLSPIWEHVGLDEREVTGVDIRAKQVTIHTRLYIDEKNWSNFTVDFEIDRG